MNIPLSKGEKFFRVFNYAFLALICVITLYPFYYIIISSFSDPVTGRCSYFWIKDFYWANYHRVLTTEGLGRAYLITIMRVALGVPLMLLITSAAAFSLTRKELAGRKVIIIFFLITMFFNGGLIPYYLVLVKVGLINTFWVFVIPMAFNLWIMIVIKVSFQGLPEGLVEAAVIDGASYAVIFFRIILPLSIPMLAALGLFSAVNHWNDWFTGLFFVQNSKLHPLQTFLQIHVVKQETGTPESIRNAYIVMATVPIVCLYPFLQKYFVKGVLLGSIN